MAVSYAVRLQFGVGGSALDSRLPNPPEGKPYRAIDPIRTRLKTSAPRRPMGGRGGITRQHHGYPASRPDFFIATKMEVGNATVTERPIGHWGFTVTCNAIFLTKWLKRASGFTVTATLIPLQSTPERASALPFHETLIPLQTGGLKRDRDAAGECGYTIQASCNRMDWRPYDHSEKVRILRAAVQGPAPDVAVLRWEMPDGGL